MGEVSLPLKKKISKSEVVHHTYNPSTPEAEAKD
jgi:hypothetical protein